MDKSLLKKTAIQSVALMLAVITLSYTIQQYQTITISANNTLPLEEVLSSEEISNSSITLINTQKPEASMNTDITKEANASEQSPALPDQVIKGDVDILNKMGESYLIIQKPTGPDITMELKDLYIKKSIQLLIAGSNMAMTSNMVARVNMGEAFVDQPIYTEIQSTDTDTNSETMEPVIIKDYGNDIVRGITVKNNLNDNDQSYHCELLIELDHIYAPIIYEDSSYYYIDLKKPQEVYDRVLVIDAGHGGKDAGALSRNEKYYEKNINLDILLQLKELLDKENIKVYYTRTADEQIYLRPRVELANSVESDFFISIHCNASTVSGPNGSEIYYYDTDYKGVRAKDMATLFLEGLSKNSLLEKRYIMKKSGEEIFILKKAKVPAILIEVGYMTNNKDINYLSKSVNRKDVAQGIYSSIMKAYEKYYPNTDVE